MKTNKFLCKLLKVKSEALFRCKCEQVYSYHLGDSHGLVPKVISESDDKFVKVGLRMVDELYALRWNHKRK